MIPISVPNFVGNEWIYVKECLDTNWVSSVGSYVDKFEQALSIYTKAKYTISTVNGTAALHISMLLAGVNQNDYVILPNITFIASVNSIAYLKASPILIDVDVNTWQMDLQLLEDFLENNTVLENNICYHKKDKRIIRCIMPVHVLGNMCNMEKLIEISSKFSLTIVEDATESLGSYYKGKHSGTFGLFGCVSFNGNKMITTGGGGMILTNDEALAKKAKHLTTQAKSDPFEYIHDEIGYNYRLVNILAALGVAQMEQLANFLEIKRKIALIYETELREIPGFKKQEITPDVSPNNWLLTYKFHNSSDLIKHLMKHNIQVRPFWVPMNQLKMFNNELYYTKNDVSFEIYKNCLSLPCSTSLAQKEQSLVIKEIKAFYN